MGLWALQSNVRNDAAGLGSHDDYREATVPLESLSEAVAEASHSLGRVDAALRAEATATPSGPQIRLPAERRAGRPHGRLGRHVPSGAPLKPGSCSGA